MFKVIGYESIAELIQAVFALKIKLAMIHVYATSFSCIAYIFIELDIGINSYIYSPSAGIWLLAIISVGDFALGLANSIINKGERISYAKLNRSAIRFIVMTWFIAITYNLHLVSPVIIQKVFIEGLFLVFCLSIIYSSVENARDLNFITKEQFEMIDSFVNPKKFLIRFLNKKKESKSENRED
jgi:diacylglycerol kinase